MKYPVIMMHPDDFKIFKNEIESKTNITVGNNPKYEGVPIRTSIIVSRGNFIVYDAVYCEFEPKPNSHE